LVREVEIAVAREDQIVQALEAFRGQKIRERRYPAALRVEYHDAVAIVGDEDAAVFMDLQPVRLAVIFDDEVDVAGRRHAEDPAMRQDDRRDRTRGPRDSSRSRLAGGHSGSTLCRPTAGSGKALRQHGDDLGFDHIRRVVGAHEVFPTLNWCR
jgi:hypothetical protein